MQVPNDGYIIRAEAYYTVRVYVCVHAGLLQTTLGENEPACMVDLPKYKYVLGAFAKSQWAQWYHLTKPVDTMVGTRRLGVRVRLRIW